MQGGAAMDRRGAASHPRGDGLRRRRREGGRAAARPLCRERPAGAGGGGVCGGGRPRHGGGRGVGASWPPRSSARSPRSSLQFTAVTLAYGPVGSTGPCCSVSWGCRSENGTEYLELFYVTGPDYPPLVVCLWMTLVRGLRQASHACEGPAPAGECCAVAVCLLTKRVCGRCAVNAAGLDGSTQQPSVVEPH